MTEIKLSKEGNIESSEYSLLSSITSILSSSLRLKETLQKIFETLTEFMGLKRGVLTLWDPVNKELHIEMAYRVPEEEKKRKASGDKIEFYKTVLHSGRIVIVPDLSKDPKTLNQIGGRINPDNITFICLPIILGDTKIGTLSVDCPFGGKDKIDQYAEILAFTTLMIAQEVQLTRLMEKKQKALEKENTLLKDELKEKYNIHNMVGNSSSMQQVYENILQVAGSNATVLVRGESGTGKELVAHSIHYNSPRSNGPFIKVNCGAIPEGLLESELFGYEKGAFTGAEEKKIGKFESADGGTIFLDEIGELPLSMQVKLLRILQEKEFERVGGVESIKVNVRVITATNRDLELEVAEKQFRQDLYYRLNVFPIYIPPLRERKTDILLLAEHFLKKIADENNKKIRRISTLAVDLINSYHWPGNVRELENCIERSVLLCNSDTIQAAHLPPTLQRSDTIESPDDTLSLNDLVDNFEREIIADTLKKTRGNKTKAAKVLGITQRIIGYKIEKLGIDPQFYKFQDTDL